jgi:hypothetical protein
LQVAMARFQREAQILGQIKHPNAVLVMDFGVEERGAQPVPYLVTEFLRGHSLEVELERKGSLPLVDVERLLTPLCDAVEEAHQVGVVHRDIKPSNVFLERLRDGTEVVKVLDFGIAKFVELSAEGLRRTQLPAPPAPSDLEFEDEVFQVRAQEPGTVAMRRRSKAFHDIMATAEDAITEAGFMVGTLPYMAPEQMTGGRVSRQTDVYAIATLIWRMLAGRLPFEGTEDDLIDAKMAGNPPAFSDVGTSVPADLEETLRAALSVQPSARPNSVLVLGEALRRAVIHGGGARRRVDVPADLTAGATILQRVSAVLGALGDAAERDEGYAAARDGLLSLDHIVARLLRSVREDSTPGPQANWAQPALAFSTALDALDRALAGITAHHGDEHLEYLRVLWAHLASNAHAVVALAMPPRDFGRPTTAATTPFGDLTTAAQGALLELADRLLARDVLDSAEALDALLREHLDAVQAALAAGAHAPDTVCQRLVAGLFRHADTLLLMELFPSGPRVRLLPLLARIPVTDVLGFGRLATLFSSSDVAGAEDLLATPVEQLEPDAPARVLRRCLLFHPAQPLREAAAAALAVSDFWNVAVYPRTPLGVLHLIFARVSRVAPAEYLKVFFLCVRDTVRAANTHEDLSLGFQLLRLFFSVPSYHEDIIFEPLLELDATLRARAGDQGFQPTDSNLYSDALAEFQAGGVVETQPPASLSHIPLPIQRRLAREGHFLAFFVSHTNERVARETLPHLMRQEDVTRFLRIPTIHRAVLVELAKVKRFFRQEGARNALLTNPRTPAHVARVFLPFIPQEQLKMLAQNRHISQEVRVLAEGFVERLALRRQ